MLKKNRSRTTLDYPTVPCTSIAREVTTSYVPVRGGKKQWPEALRVVATAMRAAVGGGVSGSAA